MNKEFYKNKNIVIVGGSFGIGEELCKKLSSFGANLAIIARSKEKLEAMKNSLGSRHFIFSNDVTNHKDLSKTFDILSLKWRRIDLIIFCVGIYEPMNLKNFDLKKSKEILEINFSSFLNLIDITLPLIKEKKIAHLAIISSVAGYFGMPNSLVYGASKAALSNLSESLLYELRDFDVKVQLINPGFVKTRLTDKNNFKMPLIISPNDAADYILKKLPKKSFEIAFPRIFVLIMKFLKILPRKMRFF